MLRERERKKKKLTNGISLRNNYQVLLEHGKIMFPPLIFNGVWFAIILHYTTIFFFPSKKKKER